MTTFKLVIGIKDGNCVQKELAESESTPLLGRKLGETIEGGPLGFSGYEFLITGGSDHCGFPMRKEIPGTLRKRIYAHKGVGVNVKRKGCRVRKTVCGNTIHEKTVQVNLKVTKAGSSPLVEVIEEKKEAVVEKKE